MAELAEESGMDAADIDRFSGPPLAERSWVSDQARACIVRPGSEDLETLVARDVRDRADGDLVWDSWRRPDGRWTVVAAIGVDSPVSTWVYDPRSRSIQPEDAASHRLASEDVVVPIRPTTSTVTVPRDEPEIDSAAQEPAPQAEEAPAAVESGPEPSESEAAREAPRPKSRKGRRASVPRWDEILFGADQSDA